MSFQGQVRLSATENYYHGLGQHIYGEGATVCTIGEKVVRPGLFSPKYLVIQQQIYYDDGHIHAVTVVPGRIKIYKTGEGKEVVTEVEPVRIIGSKLENAIRESGFIGPILKWEPGKVPKTILA